MENVKWLKYQNLLISGVLIILFFILAFVFGGDLGQDISDGMVRMSAN